LSIRVKDEVCIVIRHREVLKVARQLAVSTVIAWFGKLSFEQQKDALDRMQGEHERSRSAKRTELVTQLAALGYTVAKKRGRPATKANGSGNGEVRKARKGKVKAKYRDPKTNETWSGRGRMASWLKSKEDAGEKIEKYLV
jgi:DNA-binding protein H-NS